MGSSGNQKLLDIRLFHTEYECIYCYTESVLRSKHNIDA